MRITNIKIKNVKGFGDPAIDIPVDMTSGKINILVAPNGWGKTSIVAAFDSLKSNKLDVIKEKKHKKDENLDSSLSICIDEVEYTADHDKNEIKNAVECSVIHCDTVVKAIGHNIGQYHLAKGELVINSVEIMSKVPDTAHLDYKITDIRKEFGKNGKIIKSRDFSKHEFLCKLDNEVFSSLEKMQSILRARKVNDVVSNLNVLTGTIEQIINNVSDQTFSVLNREPNYSTIVSALCAQDATELDKFDTFYQINYLYKKDRKKLKSVVDYDTYSTFVEKFNENIKELNSSWKTDIKARLQDGKLVVNFPSADEISNGQRDLLTFVCRLKAFQSKMRVGKKYLLLIDEIFDYLDDANLLAAQFYLSSLLEKSKEEGIELCIGLFTHLDPNFFHSYVLNRKNTKTVYLKLISPRANIQMKTYIAFRNGLDRKVPDDKTLYDDLSKYFFHYCPEEMDLQQILANKHVKNLPETWGKKDNLIQYIVGELNKYLSDAEDYDPYGVCFAIRIFMEKKVYASFALDEQKEEFIKTLTTKAKIIFAEKNGVIIPDAYYVLSLIHNEADHLQYDINKLNFMEKPAVYKLSHPAIKHIVSVLFDYQDGHPITKEIFF